MSSNFKWLFAFFMLLLIACNSTPNLIPKERAYPRVDYPAKNYQASDLHDCPFSFEYPIYGEIKTKAANEDQSSNRDACWFDIDLSDFNGSIHCSYIPITNDTILYELIEDAFTVVDQVNKRSNYREDQVIQKDQNTGGLLFTFEGPAASQAQFFLTDSTSHFFKAALYFNAKVRPDSLAPISAFIKQDVNHMIESFQWKSAK